MKADLHVHSLISDGVREPAELVRIAEAGGLDVLSITDHDTLLAHTDGTSSTTLRIIIGIELSATREGREYHFLGYFPKMPTEAFRSYVEGIEAERRERMRQAIRRLVAIGFRLDFEDFLARQRSRMLTSAHLAKYMVDVGAASTEEEAFRLHLKGGRSVVPPPYTPITQAIELINGAGGISVWAHPPVAEFDGMVDQVVGMGLQGIEARNYWRPEVDPAPFVEAAVKHGLVTTGGTDYHSDGHPCPLGSQHVGASMVGDLLARL